eukprot:9068547-Alexandrium_andersonii.AAC.1
MKAVEATEVATKNQRGWQSEQNPDKTPTPSAIGLTKWSLLGWCSAHRGWTALAHPQVVLLRENELL